MCLRRLLTLLPPPDYFSATPKYAGEGEEKADLEISSYEALEEFATSVSDGTNDYSGKTVKLSNNFPTDGTDKKLSTPIGSYSLNYDTGEFIGKAFKGNFDGNNKTVNLGINKEGTEGVGMFSCTDGKVEIKNLTVSGSVVGGRYTGGIIGYAKDEITLTNCHNKATVSGSNCVGGLVGFANDTVTMESCTNSGTVSGSDDGAGGFVGYAKDTVTMTDCSNYGDVSGLGRNVGGLWGYVYSTITNNNSKNIGKATNAYNGNDYTKSDSDVMAYKDTSEDSSGNTYDIAGKVDNVWRSANCWIDDMNYGIYDADNGETVGGDSAITGSMGTPEFENNGRVIKFSYTVTNTSSTESANVKPWFRSDTKVNGCDSNTNQVDGKEVMKMTADGVTFFAYGDANSGSFTATPAKCGYQWEDDPSDVTKVADNFTGDSAYCVFYGGDTGDKIDAGVSKTYNFYFGLAKEDQVNDIVTGKIHSWTYSASGNQLTATCDKNCSDAKTHTNTLTLTAENKLYDGTEANAKAFATAEEYLDWVNDKSLPEVHYVGRDGTEYTDSTTPPTKAGKYTAKISPVGDSNTVATADFEIYDNRVSDLAVDLTIDAPQNTQKFTDKATVKSFKAVRDGSIDKVEIDNVYWTDNRNNAVKTANCGGDYTANIDLKLSVGKGYELAEKTKVTATVNGKEAVVSGDYETGYTVSYDFDTVKHIWDDGKVVKNATKKHGAVRLFTCTVCQTAKRTEYLPQSKQTIKLFKKNYKAKNNTVKIKAQAKGSKLRFRALNKSKYYRVNKYGRIRFRNGAKGTYKIKVRIRALVNNSYKQAKITKVIKVKVK